MCCTEGCAEEERVNCGAGGVVLLPVGCRWGSVAVWKDGAEGGNTETKNQL